MHTHAGTVFSAAGVDGAMDNRGAMRQRPVPMDDETDDTRLDKLDDAELATALEQ